MHVPVLLPISPSDETRLTSASSVASHLNHGRCRRVIALLLLPLRLLPTSRITRRFSLKHPDDNIMEVDRRRRVWCFPQSIIVNTWLLDTACLALIAQPGTTIMRPPFVLASRQIDIPIPGRMMV